VDAQDVERPQPKVEDAGPLPEFLKVGNRTPLTPEQQERVDAAMSRTSDTYWAAQIRASWQKCVTSIIETGKLLIEAKGQLGHGRFEAMSKTKLPFNPRTAQMLMGIAEHPVISNANHGSHLPPSWRTLYELTKIPDKTLLAEIENGSNISANAENVPASSLSCSSRIYASRSLAFWKKPTPWRTSNADY